MRKFSLAIIIIFLLFILGIKDTQASILIIDKEGNVILNVLSEENSSQDSSQKGSLRITSAPNEVKYADAKVSLNKEKGKVFLSVLSPSGGKNFDVTNYNDRILEIEERPAVEKLSISLSNGQFLISQGGVSAETYYQIEVDPKSARLALETPTGYKFLTILPRQAVDSLVRAKIATTFTSQNKVSIFEDTSGNLYYEIEARKVIPIFNIYDYDFPVKARVSATTGEIISIDEPTWLKFFGFLFT